MRHEDNETSSSQLNYAISKLDSMSGARSSFLYLVKFLYKLLLFQHLIIKLLLPFDKVKIILANV